MGQGGPGAGAGCCCGVGAAACSRALFGSANPLISPIISAKNANYNGIAARIGTNPKRADAYRGE